MIIVIPHVRQIVPMSPMEGIIWVAILFLIPALIIFISWRINRREE